MICWIEGKIFFLIFDHKGAIEKCVGCFLVYLFCWSLFFKKSVLVMMHAGLTMIPVRNSCNGHYYYAINIQSIIL